MSPEALLAKLRALSPLVLCRHDHGRTGLVASAVLTPTAVVAAAQKLYEDGYFLADISMLQVREGFLATYHLDSTLDPGRVALRALAPDGRFFTLAHVYQGAEWHEREAADFFGVGFVGNPNPVPLLLPADFPADPPLKRAEKELAPMAALGLFGEAPEVLDPSWAPLVGQGEGGAL